IDVLFFFLLKNLYSLHLIDSHFFPILMEYYMFMKHFEGSKNRSTDPGDGVGVANCSLFFSEIPKINALPLVFHSGPRIPKTVMMVMIGCLYARQFLPRGRPKRMDKPASFKNLTHPLRRHHGCKIIPQQGPLCIG